MAVDRVNCLDLVLVGEFWTNYLQPPLVVIAHGFSIPDLDFRADFVPGEANLVRLTPQKTGKFEFLCDNFCGSEHEEMDGHMVVEE